MRRTLIASLLLTCSTAVAAIETGPEVGTRVPDFKVQDQKGETRTLADLSGPEGLLLLFHRSADW